MPQVVSARLLGSPQVEIDGAPPPPELLWRKHLALCIVLWLAPERRRSRDQLIGLLWSEKEDRAARHSLNEALRVIRRAAGSDTIASTTDYVEWAIAPALDTDRCMALQQDDPVAAAALIGGPFCDGLIVSGASEFESWLTGERERWTARSIEILLRAAAIAENRGDIGTTLAFAERAAVLNPVSDVAAQAIIRAHWLGGDRLAALAAGERYRVRLLEELGLALDPKTAALLGRIERGHANARPATASNPERRPPFLAHEQTLEALLREWRHPGEASRARLLVISGASGTGRSRLLEELTARAAVAGCTTASMRAVEADASDAEAAVVGLARAGLESAPGVVTASGAALSAFARRLPAWEERFGKSKEVTPLGMREAFETIVQALSVEQPLMLAIDDADRLHPDELRWLMALLRSSSALDITLALTVRTGSGSDAVDDLTRRAGRELAGIAVRLDPLTISELQRLVDWAVPSWGEAERERLARRLLAESGGLPAVAVEVLNVVRSGGSLERSEAWPAADRTLDATLPGPLPEPLVAAVRIAFRSLDSDAQQILTAASLLNEPFSAEQVGSVAEIDDAARRDAVLDRLEWDGWIVADARGYQFPARAKRTLIANEMTTPGHRRRLQARVTAAQG